MLPSVWSICVVLLCTIADFAGALPSEKTCVEQTGSDQYGVPQVHDIFYAMSYNWRRNISITDGFFNVEETNVVVDVPEDVFGFFAIVSAG